MLRCCIVREVHHCTYAIVFLRDGALLAWKFVDISMLHIIFVTTVLRWSDDGMIAMLRTSEVPSSKPVQER